MSFSPQDRLLLVDAHAYAYRSYYAIRNLTGPDGAPTNAIFGFIKAMAVLRQRCAPTHVAVIWDGGLDEERVATHPGYKAERDPMPDPMEVQLDGIVEWLAAAGLASHCQDGIEADDAIATLACRAEAVGLPVVIASADKDFMQLVRPGISLLNPNDKYTAFWGDDEVRAKCGVLPSQVVDWLSLVGDAVDGIPGVPGVGPKTATKLLASHGTLEAIYENLATITPERLLEKLRASKADMARNQDLIRLRDALPLDLSLEDLALGDEDYEASHALFTRWGFRTFLRELETRHTIQGELL